MQTKELWVDVAAVGRVCVCLLLLLLFSPPPRPYVFQTYRFIPA